jgi:hypothetical protein
MPVIGSPNAHARNHRVPCSFRATLRKIAHLMIRCRIGDPLLFRMTRNSRLMLSIRRPLSVVGSKAYPLPRVGRRFRQSHGYRYLVRVLRPCLSYAPTRLRMASRQTSKLLFTQRLGSRILRTSPVQEFSEFRPTGGCAGLLLLVLWRPRNDGARSEILTTAPPERGKK